jgi:hypothetical protein
MRLPLSPCHYFAALGASLVMTLVHALNVSTNSEASSLYYDMPSSCPALPRKPGFLVLPRHQHIRRFVACVAS